jgi:hypothetical protein
MPPARGMGRGAGRGEGRAVGRLVLGGREAGSVDGRPTSAGSVVGRFPPSGRPGR